MGFLHKSGNLVGERIFNNVSHQENIKLQWSSLHFNRMAVWNNNNKKEIYIPTIGKDVAHPEVSCTVSRSVHWHNNFGILFSLAICAKTKKKKKKKVFYAPKSTLMSVLKIIPYICAPTDIH